MRDACAMHAQHACDAQFVRAVADQNCIFAKSQINTKRTTLHAHDWLRNKNPCQV